MCEGLRRMAGLSVGWVVVVVMKMVVVVVVEGREGNDDRTGGGCQFCPFLILPLHALCLSSALWLSSSSSSSKNLEFTNAFLSLGDDL
ncbi:hypothetical protein E2C01_006483 [Portunus trituberculatus]|uniref:Uncharacterized protein n=1 Tax=Portunus trituberculatus TaxID=210409 RepID=A0A5B7CWE8_PORTR|nr:hypothetical protein [Portunus trituberculatus]